MQVVVIISVEFTAENACSYIHEHLTGVLAHAMQNDVPLPALSLC